MFDVSLAKQIIQVEPTPKATPLRGPRPKFDYLRPAVGQPIFAEGEWEGKQDPTGRKKKKGTSLSTQAHKARTHFLANYCRMTGPDGKELRTAAAIQERLTTVLHELDLWTLPYVYVPGAIVAQGMGGSTTIFVGPRYAQSSVRVNGTLQLTEKDQKFMALPKALLKAFTLDEAANTFKSITKKKGA